MFDPDLINKFQQNLRMAQIHSAGGVTEDNLMNIWNYVHEARDALVKLSGIKDELRIDDINRRMIEEQVYENETILGVDSARDDAEVIVIPVSKLKK